MNAMADAPASKVVTPPPRRRHRFLRTLLIVLAVLIGLAVLIRLVLDPIATRQTRKALDGLKGYAASFERVHVTLLPPGYTITQVKLIEDRTSDGGDDSPKARRQRAERAAESKHPLLFVERAHAGVALGALLRGDLVASLRLEQPKLIISQPAAGATEKKAEDKAPAKAPDLSAALAEAPALRVSRIEMLGGEILVRVPQGDEVAKLWIHDLDMAAQNLGTRREETGGRPATVSARGVVGRSGELTLFVSADPLSRPLSFAGQTSLRGLRATELYGFLAPNTGMQATEGTIDVFASFRSENGVISGGVKPVLKNIEVGPADGKLWTRLKAWAADKAVDLGADRVPGRNAVATTVPIKGNLTDPDLQLWPAVLGVIRNAFVAGLESGFAHLPPPTADEKQGLVEQAKKAVTEEAGPPKAQPVREDDDAKAKDDGAEAKKE